MEREHDFRRVMELTDPNTVFLIMDTGHNVLGGMDVVKMTDEFFPRITEYHLKDTFPQWRGNKEGPTQAMHRQKSVYASVGQGGGVDFPGVLAVMRKKHFKGWAVFDIDCAASRRWHRQRGRQYRRQRELHAYRSGREPAARQRQERIVHGKLGGGEQPAVIRLGRAIAAVGGFLQRLAVLDLDGAAPCPR